MTPRVIDGQELFVGGSGQLPNHRAVLSWQDARCKIHAGLFATTSKGKPVVVEYEPDTDLRNTKRVPLLEEGGIDAFIEREVLPYAPDAWVDDSKTKIGYEIRFTRYFYKPDPMHTLAEIQADIVALEQETEGLLEDIIGSKVS